MTGLDRASLILNVAAILSWGPAFITQGAPGFYIAVLLSVSACLLSSIVIARKERATEAPKAAAPTVPVDEFDPHTVLDLDARLEALERAQHDAVDAARWRALVESGQASGPAAEPLASGTDGRRNGAADRA